MMSGMYTWTIYLGQTKCARKTIVVPQCQTYCMHSNNAQICTWPPKFLAKLVTLTALPKSLLG